MTTTYRVLLMRQQDATWVTHNNSTEQTGLNSIDRGALVDDAYSFTQYEAAATYRTFMAREFPGSTYVVLQRTEEGERTWDDIFASVAPHSPFIDEVDDDDDDEDDEVHTCNECGGVDEYEDHEQYRCERCEWWCDVCDCNDCLIWSDSYEGQLCESCYDAVAERHEPSRPGVSRRNCGICISPNIHHDDVTETFLCDHEARIRIDEGHLVTLARPLPTLEAV